MRVPHEDFVAGILIDAFVIGNPEAVVIGEWITGKEIRIRVRNTAGS